MADDSATTLSYRDEAHAIHARDVHFDFSSVPMHYIPGEVLATHVANVMHLVLPEGERAMAACLGEALPYIEDERLREEVTGFVGQESMHASSHEGARTHLQSIGLDVESFVAKIAWLVDRVLGDHGLSGRAKQEWLRERLGLFAGMEHFTAVIGEWLLEAEVLQELGMHPTMLDLVRWHGAEEVEHRSVVFDAYMHVDGSYARRARMAVLGSAAIFATGMLTLAWLVANDPERRRSRNPYQRYLSPLVKGLSATRRRLIPNMATFLTEVPVYLRSGFHPSQLDGMELALRYLATAPIRAAA